MKVKYIPVGSTLENGYTTKTTFYQDFSIADALGPDAVKNTYNRVFNSWKGNIEYITELVIVLSWKCRDTSKENPELSKLYHDLYYNVRGWVMDNIKGDEYFYFWKWTE